MSVGGRISLEHRLRALLSPKEMCAEIPRFLFCVRVGFSLFEQGQGAHVTIPAEGELAQSALARLSVMLRAWVGHHSGQPHWEVCHHFSLEPMAALGATVANGCKETSTPLVEVPHWLTVAVGES